MGGGWGAPRLLPGCAPTALACDPSPFTPPWAHPRVGTLRGCHEVSRVTRDHLLSSQTWVAGSYTPSSISRPPRLPGGWGCTGRWSLESCSAPPPWGSLHPPCTPSILSLHPFCGPDYVCPVILQAGSHSKMECHLLSPSYFLAWRRGLCGRGTVSKDRAERKRQGPGHPGPWEPW